MAEAEIIRIAGEAAERWPVSGLTASIATGGSNPARTSCWWSRHPAPAGRVRGRAFLMDYLKPARLSGKRSTAAMASSRRLGRRQRQRRGGGQAVEILESARGGDGLTAIGYSLAVRQPRKEDRDAETAGRTPGLRRCAASATLRRSVSRRRPSRRPGWPPTKHVRDASRNGRSDRSTDDLGVGEPVADLLRGRLRRIGAVHGVLADRQCVNLADRALGRGLAGLVAPITSRFRAMAFSPSSTCMTVGPDDMNSTSSPKNGRSLWTA